MLVRVAEFGCATGDPATGSLRSEKDLDQEETMPKIQAGTITMNYD
jgi:hypothetical protein